MKLRAQAIFCGIFIALLLGVQSLDAGVFTGVIEEISLEPRRIIVHITSRNKKSANDIRASATILLDGKPAKFEMIKVGMTASVTTNFDDEVTRINAKSTEKAATKTETYANKEEPEEEAPSEDPPGSLSKEWPQFRGPNRDNISQETDLLPEWPENGPPLAWKQTGLGEGYSSVAVANGKVYTMGNRGKDEMLFALDAQTGKHLWQLRTGDAYHDGTGDGPRGTPTVDGDKVYALGANGDLVCADAETGKRVWHLNILQEFKAKNIQWGISESVLIDGENLICTPGGTNATFAALNKQDGTVVWRARVSGLPQAAYASIIAITVGGVKQYVNFVHTSIVGVQASDGKFLWDETKPANGTANCSSPLFAGDSVFSASGYGTGGALVKLTASGQTIRSKVTYHTPKMRNHHGGMAVVKGNIYGFDDSVLTCLDWKTGNLKWSDRSVGKGSLTVADGRLYLRSEKGPLALAELSPKGYVETGRFDQPDRSRHPAWSHPAIADGKLYLRDMDTLLVYNIRQ